MNDNTAPRNCPKCQTANDPAARFCEKCGTALVSGTRARVAGGRAGLGRLNENTHRSKIRGARITLAVVALLTIVVGVFLHVSTNAEIAKAQATPGMVVNQDVVAKLSMMIYATYAIGAVFIGLFFWAKSNPFAACLTGMIIYISSMLVNAAMDPSTIYQGLIVKAIIILALANGIKAGLAHRRMLEKEAHA